MRIRELLIVLALLTVGANLLFGAGAAESTAPREKVTIQASIYDRGWCPASQGTMSDNWVVDWINENAPVRVEYVVYPRWEQTQLLNVAFAAGDAPDYIFEYDGNWMKQLWADGLTLALDDYLAAYAPTTNAFIAQYPLARATATMPDGKMYFFPLSCRKRG
jgi:putative aldouronate transport system substrate-binding protein